MSSLITLVDFRSCFFSVCMRPLHCVGVVHVCCLLDSHTVTTLTIIIHPHNDHTLTTHSYNSHTLTTHTTHTAKTYTSLPNFCIVHSHTRALTYHSHTHHTLKKRWHPCHALTIHIFTPHTTNSNHMSCDHLFQILYTKAIKSLQT